MRRVVRGLRRSATPIYRISRGRAARGCAVEEEEEEEEDEAESPNLASYRGRLGYLFI